MKEHKSFFYKNLQRDPVSKNTNRISVLSNLVFKELTVITLENIYGTLKTGESYIELPQLA